MNADQTEGPSAFDQGGDQNTPTDPNEQLTPALSLGPSAPLQGKRQPWAVLVCQFSDDKDPAEVLVRDLPQINNPDPNDPQTALQLFQMFFTKQGNSTFNAVRYFNEMSHGSIDLDDSQVFVVKLNITKAQGVLQEPFTPEQGAADRVMITQVAQAAALQQGVPLSQFYGIVVTSHFFLSMAQGGPIPGGPSVPGPQGWAGMDYRWVRNNGIEAWGQEMGHGFGLDHSRSEGIPIGPDGSTPDYTDRLDVMSTANADSGVDPNYGLRGPGINAWNMRGRAWLDETRVWHCPDGSFDQSLQLRPLHRKDLAGYLAAELPPMNDTDGFPRYLVEYRKHENWDNGTPLSCILVHRFEGNIGQFLGTHSYVMPGTRGQYKLLLGDRFAPSGGMGPQLSVTTIDDGNSTATVRLTMPSGTGSTLYVVQAGDTLSAIAQRFGVSLAALESANPQIADPNRIFPGQAINIPGPRLTYVVQAGDTLSAIAQRFGVSLAALEFGNPQIVDPNRIFPGQTINLP